MRVRVIINPSSGRQIFQKNAERIIEQLLADGTFAQIDVIKTTGAQDAYKAARFFRPWDYDLIFTVGGDGTVNEVVNGLMDGQHQTPLAILPAGTVNDFAYAMHLPREVSEVCQMLRQRRTIKVDVGQAGRQYFLNVAAGGMLTDVAYKVPSEAKTVLGQLAYVLEGARDLPGQFYRSVTLSLHAPGYVVEDDILLFIVSNTSSVGGFRSLAPEASASDGLLDVVIIHKANFLELLPLMVQMANGVHVNNPLITYFQTPELTIDCLDSCAMPLDVDGERGGELPIKISVLPKALTLVVP